MTDIINATSARNVVAIDIARYWNYVLIESVGGKRQRFKMANTAADFDRLIALLQSLDGLVRIGLEPTGDYHRALAHRLLSAGFEVAGISSVAQARYSPSARFLRWLVTFAQMIIRLAAATAQIDSNVPKRFHLFNLFQVKRGALNDHRGC